MLSQARAQTTLPVADLAVAGEWYREKLGLEPVELHPDAAIYEIAEGTRFALFPTPNPDRGGHTQMGFMVPDVRAEVTALRERGVVFEEYDLPGLRTEDAVAEMDGRSAAWFKDCAGNLLGLVHFS
ncbi:VOC family protein [Kitasatospora sp. McL0602]|uniref:VOC family protein n=1 Tax=Kitasatospora sp. McL0602 TaxID=3439530 RepID=UPI003F8BC7F7